MKGLTLLEALVDQQGKALTIEELRLQLNLSKSNVHRTLQTLAHANYVAKHEHTGTYQPTMKLLELGARQLARMDVRKLAYPIMRSLGEKTEETVNLSILEGLSVVYIETIECLQPVRSDTAIGARAPAHATATGKALLAHQYESHLARHAGDLEAYTSATIAALPALKEELARVRRAGHAINHGEWHLSVGGVAAPVFDGLGKVVAALGISGPLERLTISKLNQFAPLVQRHAAEVSRALGYRGCDNAAAEPGGADAAAAAAAAGNSGRPPHP